MLDRAPKWGEKIECWQKEALGLRIGEWIVWQDEAITLESGQTVISPGMKGRVISLHDGAYLDAVSAVLLARAVVEFANGQRLIIDARTKFEKIHK